MAGVGNYFLLSPEEYETLSSEEELLKITSTEEVLKDFRSLECTASGTHFGYQHRSNPNILACSAKCLAATRGLLKKNPNVASATRILPPAFNYRSSVERDEPSEKVKGSLSSAGINGVSSIDKVATDKECDEPDCRVASEDKLKHSEPLITSYLNLEDVKVQVSKSNRLVRPKPAAEDDKADQIQTVQSVAPKEPAQVKVKSSEALSSQVKSSGASIPQVKSSGASISQVKSSGASSSQVKSSGASSSQVKSSGASSSQVKSSGASSSQVKSSGASSSKVKGHLVDPNKAPFIGLSAAKIAQQGSKTLDLTETCQADKKIWTMRDVIPSLSLVNNAHCAIVHTWYVDTYTINAVADAAKIQQLDDAILEYCNKAPPLTRIPKSGEILLAPYEDSYYRCKVDIVLDEKAAKVEFLDYGDWAVVELSKCKELTKKIMEHPIYGIKFVLSLDSLVVPADFQTPPQVDAVKEKEMILEIASSPGWEWAGKLHVKDAKVTLNEIIKKHLIGLGTGAPKNLPTQQVSSGAANATAGTIDGAGSPGPAAVATAGTIAGAAGSGSSGPAAVSVSNQSGSTVAPKKLMEIKLPTLASLKKPELKVPTLIPPKVNKSLIKPPALSPAPKAIQATEIPTKLPSPAASNLKKDILVSPSSVSSSEIREKIASPKPKSASVVKPKTGQLFAENMKLSDKLQNGALVHVNFMWHYGKFTISARDDDSKLDAMSGIIDEYAATAPPMARQPEKDEILLAPYQGTYYRGKVIIVNGKSVTVEFIDYGDQVTVELSECRELHSNILNHPRYGAVLILSDVGHRPVEAKLAAPEGGQIEITDTDKKAGILYGRLWLDIENSFNDMVKATFGISDE